MIERRRAMMASFDDRELRYLLGERRLARFATIGADGYPHVVPVGWRYDSGSGTIEISGRNFAATRKWHNARTNPKVALVVDDVLPPWRPRSVMVQGDAEPVPASESRTGEAFVRIRPTKIISWGLEATEARS